MKAIWVVVALVVGFAGAWGYATFDVSSRLHGYHQRVDEMRFIARGGHIMDEDAIFDRLEAAGVEAGVDVVEMNVRIEDLDATSMDRAGSTTQMLAGKLAEPAANPRASDLHYADDERVELGSSEMTLTGTLIEVHVDIAARKWLWDGQDRVEVRRTVGQRVVMDR